MLGSTHTYQRKSETNRPDILSPVTYVDCEPSLPRWQWEGKSGAKLHNTSLLWLDERRSPVWAKVQLLIPIIARPLGCAIALASFVSSRSATCSA